MTVCIPKHDPNRFFCARSVTVLIRPIKNVFCSISCLFQSKLTLCFSFPSLTLFTIQIYSGSTHPPGNSDLLQAAVCFITSTPPVNAVCVWVYMCARMGTGESGRSCGSETECENFSLYRQR